MLDPLSCVCWAERRLNDDDGAAICVVFLQLCTDPGRAVHALRSADRLSNPCNLTVQPSVYRHSRNMHWSRQDRRLECTARVGSRAHPKKVGRARIRKKSTRRRGLASAGWCCARCEEEKESSPVACQSFHALHGRARGWSRRRAVLVSIEAEIQGSRPSWTAGGRSSAANSTTSHSTDWSAVDSGLAAAEETPRPSARREKREGRSEMRGGVSDGRVRAGRHGLGRAIDRSRRV